jgi:hypothetical protein
MKCCEMAQFFLRCGNQGSFFLGNPIKKSAGLRVWLKGLSSELSASKKKKKKKEIFSFKELSCMCLLLLLLVCRGRVCWTEAPSMFILLYNPDFPQDASVYQPLLALESSA